MLFSASSRAAVPGLGLCLALLASGCGPGKASLSGTVTFNGAPLKKGTLSFITEDNTVTTAEINSDGTYSVPEMRSGKVLVGVSVPTESSNAYAQARGPGSRGDGKKAMAMLAPAGAPQANPNEVVIPPHLANPDTSEKVLQLKSGANKIDIDF